MNRSSPSPDPDDLDRMLSKFFRAQLPAQWPDPPVPVEVPSARAGGSPWRTRLTLAASVAALLGFGFLLSGGPATTDGKPADSLLNGSTAEGKGLKKHIEPELQPMK